MQITQKELALVLRVSVSSIARWEAGICNPTKKTKHKLRCLFVRAVSGDIKND